MGPAQHGCAAGNPCEIAYGVERHLQIISTSLYTKISAAPLRLQTVSRKGWEVGK